MARNAFAPSPPPERIVSEGIGGLTARKLFEMGELAYALLREGLKILSKYLSQIILAIYRDLERRGAKYPPQKICL